MKHLTFINKMNKTDIAYLSCIRSLLSFKTNALWFIVLFIYLFFFMKTATIKTNSLILNE